LFTTLSSVFTGADLAITADDVNFLFTKTTSTVLDLRGFEGKLVPNGNTIQAAYSTPSKIFQFPTTYNTNFSGTSALTKTVPGSDVGQAVYEVRFTTNSNYKDTIDGWGKVITPVGAYKGLRKKRVETTTTNIEIRLCNICPWSNAPGYPSTTTTTRYTYPVLEAKGSVLTFDYDSANNVTGVTYSLIPPVAPISGFTYNQGANGSVTFTNTVDGYPNTYSWNFGDGTSGSTPNPNHTFSANGSYYVCLTVTNAGGSNTFCDSVRVTSVCPVIAANFSITPAGCGQQDGSVTSSPSGGASPYTFLWSNAATTSSISNLSAGSYSVTIRDANNCSVVASANVSNAGAPTVSEAHTDASCYGVCDGTIDITISGGTSPYITSWSQGQTTEDISGLCAGTYSVTVTDASTCAAISSITITQPDSLIVTVVITNASSSTSLDGSLSASVSGGTLPHDYEWCNGASTMNITGLPCDTCSLTVTDANGCSFSSTYTVDCPVGIADIFSKSSFNIYPNPSSGIFNIEINSNQNTIVEVYNLLGEEIISNSFTNSSVIDLSGKSSGIYIIKVSADGVSKMKRIIMQ
jgi:PKD repeat protein